MTRGLPALALPAVAFGTIAGAAVAGAGTPSRPAAEPTATCMAWQPVIPGLLYLGTPPEPAGGDNDGVSLWIGVSIAILPSSLCSPQAPAPPAPPVPPRQHHVRQPHVRAPRPVPVAPPPPAPRHTTPPILAVRPAAVAPSAAAPAGAPAGRVVWVAPPRPHAGPRPLAAPEPGPPRVMPNAGALQPPVQFKPGRPVLPVGLLVTVVLTPCVATVVARLGRLMAGRD